MTFTHRTLNVWENVFPLWNQHKVCRAKILLTLTDAKELHFLVSSLRVYMSLNQRAVTKIVKKFNKVSQDRVEDKSHDLRDTAMLDTLTTLIHNYKVRFYHKN
jgi:hypothetical protein